jgi:BASS family bile acid:Na+ symporter
MRIRVKAPEWTARREAAVKRAAMVAFVLVVIGAVASELELLTDHFAEVALAALALNVAAMAVSFTIAQLARLGPHRSTAIAMELGVHNATLAIAVATTIDTELAVPGAVYSAFMFLTAGLFARVMATRNGSGVDLVGA